MWRKNHSTEIAALRDRISTLEIELEREKNGRLADKLEFVKRMEAFKSELSVAISSLNPKREKSAPIAFRNARDFVTAVEREENLNVA